MPMTLRQFQVDAFAAHVFGGNPAAVVPLEHWLPDTLLQAIAEENNLSETAFFVPEGPDRYELRWFTPLTEVDLCGHATLAAAHVLYAHLGTAAPGLTFLTRSGELTVRRLDDSLEMSLPARPPQPCEPPAELLEALGEPPQETLAAEDYIAVYADEATVRRLAPDMALLAQLDLRGVSVTAPGAAHDFVSRFFAPRLGVPEDPVCGSSHCQLAPYWGRRLRRSVLRAFQCSRRGGELQCRLDGDRVLLSGPARTFMEAVIHLDSVPR